MEQRVVTILGGTGFLGRYVVGRLAKSGFRIRIISRNPNDSLELITAGHVGQIALFAGDINDPASYAPYLKNCYAVINLVGILFDRGKQNFTAIHSLGAERLALAAKAAGVQRFIQISAMGVENDAGSNYSRTKFLGERAVAQAFPDATIIRPSIMFGAEDNFFNKFAKMAIISPFLPLIGGGRTLFQPVYVDDIAKAIEALLLQDKGRGQIYELGGSHVYSFKQILEYILFITGKVRLFINVPFPIASIIGRIGEFLPTPPLTRDQIKLLKYDNTTNPTLKSFKHLGITPTSVEVIVPEYLSIFGKQAAE